MMEPKAMASIDFCPLAKWVGEWRKYGLVAGEGDHPSCTKRSEGRMGIPPRSPSEARHARRRLGPCARGPEQAPELHKQRDGIAVSACAGAKATIHHRGGIRRQITIYGAIVVMIFVFPT